MYYYYFSSHGWLVVIPMSLIIHLVLLARPLPAIIDCYFIIEVEGPVGFDLMF